MSCLLASVHSRQTRHWFATSDLMRMFTNHLRQSAKFFVQNAIFSSYVHMYVYDHMSCIVTNHHDDCSLKCLFLQRKIWIKYKE